jgi:hypothetical protein
MLYICCLYNIISRRIIFVVYYCFFHDVNYIFLYLQPQWKQFENFAKDSRFTSMFHALPSIVEASKSSVTVSKYKFYFEKFRKCCTMCSLQSSPAPSTTVILYIVGIIQQGVSAGVLESDWYAIKWHHDFNLASNPCADNFLSFVIATTSSGIASACIPMDTNCAPPRTSSFIRMTQTSYRGFAIKSKRR